VHFNKSYKAHQENFKPVRSLNTEF